MNGSSEVIENIAKTPRGMGYSGMGYKTDKVNWLKVSKKKGEPGVDRVSKSPAMANILSPASSISTPLANRPARRSLYRLDPFSGGQKLSSTKVSFLCTKALHTFEKQREKFSGWHFLTRIRFVRVRKLLLCAGSGARKRKKVQSARYARKAH
jgi:hypothetical protein